MVRAATEVPKGRARGTNPALSGGDGARAVGHGGDGALPGAVRFSVVLAVLLGGCGDGTGPAELGPYCAEGVEITPAAAGLDPAGLEEAYGQAAATPDLLGLLVLRNDRTVCEAYFRGYGPETAHNVKSVSKSVLSALVGIALAEGHLPGLDARIAPYFPEYYDGLVDDPRKADVTIRHLLTMTGGWQWIENGPVTTEWWTSPNWNQFALALPLEADPGTDYTYTTAGTHLLATILERTVPGGLRAYAEDRLFEPLGVRVHRWDEDPQGNPFGGSEMYFTARDLASFGILFMNGGLHGGRTVVPSAWVEESTGVQVDLNGAWDYGFLWWLRDFAGHRAHHAWGYGGQFIFDFPSLDLVIVALSTHADHTGQSEAVLDLVEEHLVPIVGSPNP